MNDLITDKLELQRLAEVYRESVAAQTISDDDLAFIASHFAPILTSLGCPTSTNLSRCLVCTRQTGGVAIQGWATFVVPR